MANHQDYTKTSLETVFPQATSNGLCPPCSRKVSSLFKDHIITHGHPETTRRWRSWPSFDAPLCSATDFVGPAASLYCRICAYLLPMLREIWKGGCFPKIEVCLSIFQEPLSAARLEDRQPQDFFDTDLPWDFLSFSSATLVLAWV
jgi:hypothetical protein